MLSVLSVPDASNSPRFGYSRQSDKAADLNVTGCITDSTFNFSVLGWFLHLVFIQNSDGYFCIMKLVYYKLFPFRPEQKDSILQR